MKKQNSVTDETGKYVSKPSSVETLKHLQSQKSTGQKSASGHDFVNSTKNYGNYSKKYLPGSKQLKTLQEPKQMAMLPNKDEHLLLESSKLVRPITKQDKPLPKPTDTLLATSAMNTLLCSLFVLASKTKFYHWNVEGSHFRDLHKLFDEQYEELNEAVDDVAETLRGYNVKAPYSLQEYQSGAIFSCDNIDKDAKAMVADLLKDNEAICGLLQEKILEIPEDPVMVDLFTVRLGVHKKAAWMLRSILK